MQDKDYLVFQGYGIVFKILMYTFSDESLKIFDNFKIILSI